MPLISTLGAASSRGFGQFAQSNAGVKYVEDYFSTYLYSGNNSSQLISNGIALANTGAWRFISATPNTNYYYGVAANTNGVYLIGSSTGNLSSIIAANGTTGASIFNRTLSGTGGNDFYNAVTVDSSGNIIAAGRNDNGFGASIVKYNSSGVLQWQRKLTLGGQTVYAKSVSTDSSGNVYVCGVYGQSGYNISFIVKYDSSGTLQWQNRIYDTATNNGTNIEAVAVSSSGNIYLAGMSYGSSTYPCATVLKLDTSGTLQWKVAFTSTYDYFYSISLDSSENVYAAGYFNLISTTYATLFKLNSSGTIQWQKQFDNNTGIGSNASYTDASGNTYVNIVTGSGGLIKVDTSGAISWQRSFAGSIPKHVYATSTTVYTASYAASSGVPAGVFVLSADGTAVGGKAGPVSMYPSSYTLSSNSKTTTTSTVAVSSGSMTAATSTYTDAAGSSTTTLYTQSAVTDAGGLIWVKLRNATNNPALVDTVRSIDRVLDTTSAAGDSFNASAVTALTAGGFSVGPTNATNGSGYNYVSWTWRKTPKFFDVISYTGNGVSGRQISHNLGSVPGMIIVKATNTNLAWTVYHRSRTATNQTLFLNTTGGFSGDGAYDDPTATYFSPGTNVNYINQNGISYVAYIFAHNAGGFGIDGTQNVISCGSFTLSSAKATVNLGYEPEFIITKRVDSTGNWLMLDTMRGNAAASGALANQKYLYTNLTDSETSSYGEASPTSTGFELTAGGSLSGTYIYMAIRRGPMKVPTDATTVFSPSIYTGVLTSSVPNNRMLAATDVWFNSSRNGSGNTYGFDRLRGWEYLLTSSTAAEDTSYDWNQTNQTTIALVSPSNWWGSSTSQVDHYFKRAPGFMDVVCYSGTGTTTQNVTHNLGVQPELIIYKSRTNGVDWVVHTPSLISQNKFLWLNRTDAATDNSAVGYTNSGAPTSTLIRPGMTQLNMSGWTYVAYLFATCPGVSKVGTYTGTGATQTISCGFTGGARYVLIKRTDNTGNWWVWDTARGMVAGTDPRLAYSTAGAEINNDWVYTTTGGFQIVTSDANINANGGTYIYLAIA
jgi:hypothetical protein